MIYEQGLQRLKSADTFQIKEWMNDRLDGNSIPLDSAYTNARLESTQLLNALFEESEAKEQEKLRQALSIVFKDAVKHQQWEYFPELTHMIVHFNAQLLLPDVLGFVQMYAADKRLKSPKSYAIGTLQNYIKDNDEISDFFNQCFFSDPVTVGDEHALQLFAGLVEKTPKDWTRLLIRLIEVNDRIPLNEKFEYRWFFGCVADNCTEDVIVEGLKILPRIIQEEILALRTQYPNLFSGYDLAREE